MTHNELLLGEPSEQRCLPWTSSIQSYIFVMVEDGYAPAAAAAATAAAAADDDDDDDDDEDEDEDEDEDDDDDGEDDDGNDNDGKDDDDDDHRDGNNGEVGDPDDRDYSIAPMSVPMMVMMMALFCSEGHPTIITQYFQQHYEHSNREQLSC